MNLREIILNTKFAADFDETVIEQNSLVLFLKEKLLEQKKYKEKWGVLKRGVKAGLIWGEELAKNFIGFVNKKNGFDDYDTLVKKVKNMKGTPIKEFYSIIPKIKIKYAFLHGFSKLKELLVESGFLNGKKRKMLVESGFLNEEGLINILLDTRNHEPFARAFLDYSPRNNINSYLINKEYQKVSNNQIYREYGMNLIEIGNEFLSDDGIFNGNIKLGKNASSIITNGDIINKKTKAEIYKSRIVFGDNEEFLALSKKSRTMINTHAPKWIRKKQIKKAFNQILNFCNESSHYFLKQPELALFSANNPAVNYLK